MNALRPMIVSGVAALALGWFGPSTPKANAQVARNHVAHPRIDARSGYAPRMAPGYPAHRGSTRHAWPVLPHNHRDWTTGRENLPLAKPWLHMFR